MSNDRWWRRRRFDLVSLLLVAAGMAVAGWMVGAGGRPAAHHDMVDDAERGRLAKTYGPARNSEHEEEWIVRDFFADRRDGVFVDVGANHHRIFSNTYYLETTLGWRGLAIEPLDSFADGYRTHRPQTMFVRAFVSDRSDEQATLFFLPANPLVTSSRKDFTERWGDAPAEITIPTVTLTDLLDSHAVKAIDFLSMDIELGEPRALAGFDIGRFRPRLVCVEAHPEVRQDILAYFARHGYVLVGRYLRADTHNLWFAPLQATEAEATE